MSEVLFAENCSSLVGYRVEMKGKFGVSGELLELTKSFASVAPGELDISRDARRIG
jgi:hypothetical protein